MSILSKKLYVQKTGGAAVACNIYSTSAEAGDKALRVRVDNTDGYIALKATDNANATGMRVKIGGIIYAVATKHESGGGDVAENAFVMTMGSSGYQYGYSRYYANYGEIEGELTHDGKAVTLVMLCYYSGYLDLAFNVDGVTSGSYNVTVNVTEIDTGRTGTITLDVPYASYIPGFYVSPDKVSADLSRFFVAANVGKKYKVEIVFN